MEPNKEKDLPMSYYKEKLEQWIKENCKNNNHKTTSKKKQARKRQRKI